MAYTLTIVESAGGLHQSGFGSEFETCGFGADGHGTCIEEYAFGSDTVTMTYSGTVVPFFTLAAAVASIPTPTVTRNSSPTNASPVSEGASPTNSNPVSEGDRATKLKASRTGLIGGVVTATVAIFIVAGVFLFLRIRRRRQQRDFFPGAASQPCASNDYLPNQPHEPVTPMSGVSSAAPLLGAGAHGYASPAVPTERDAAYDPRPYATSSTFTQSHMPPASSTPASSSALAPHGDLYVDLKQRQQEIVDEYKEGLRVRGGRGGSEGAARAHAPAPVIRHVDSGLRGGALGPQGSGSEPVELPPYYSPD
ncbi:hypothetical protein GGX14DRAFT_432038 [Mycena pura]|uniref:Uncharacterized protein n=1 Tax=Mycena pura TaxID=153505 RepID=A0AAD6VRV6_9AGAR|nr:hypothetical protein GGX14DRAFT_432038 [Mycena pura]